MTQEIVVQIPAILDQASYKTITWSMTAVSAKAGGEVKLQFGIDQSALLGRFGIGILKPAWLEVTGIELASYLATERQIVVDAAAVFTAFSVSPPMRSIQQLVRNGVVLSVYCQVLFDAPAGAQTIVLQVPTTACLVESAYGRQAANVLEWKSTNGILTITE